MEQATEIPGLVEITDTRNSDGSCTITLEIEEGRQEEFFKAFGLTPDDQEGLQALVTRAIEEYLVHKGHVINRPT